MYTRVGEDREENMTHVDIPYLEIKYSCWGHGTNYWPLGRLNLFMSPYSPLSWPMADWFMEECMMLSDWTLGGRGGI